MIETEILIEAALDRVWAVLANFTDYTVWNPYLVQVEGEAREGTTIIVHSVPAPGAAPLVQEVKVLEVRPLERMRWEGGLPDRNLFRGDHHWTLEAEGTATRVKHFEHFSGSLASTILNQHGEAIRANFVRFNEALKARAEEQA